MDRLIERVERVRALLWRIEERCHTQTRTHLLELVQEALAALNSNAMDRLLERVAAEVAEIIRLEADVQYYSGNEAAGRNEIQRRKAEAFDRIAALAPSPTEEGQSPNSKGKVQ